MITEPAPAYSAAKLREYSAFFKNATGLDME